MLPYSLTIDDAENIKAAIKAGDKIWESKLLKDFKNAVKNFYRAQQEERCCYCQRVTVGEFKMVLDIEHILPKGIADYRKYMFDPKNLCVACKRCNMEIKRQDISFFHGVMGEFYSSNNYRFIHPHSDIYWNHMKYSVQVENDFMLIQYSVVDGSAKGLYTYKYFRLEELEINTLNVAQGLVNEEISPAIDQDLASEIRKLLDNT